MKNSTLRNRIIRYVLFSGLLTLLIFTVATYFSQRTRIIRDSRKNALLTVSKVGGEIEGGFNKYAAFDQIIASDEIIREFARSQTDRTISSVEDNPYLYSTMDMFNKIIAVSVEVEDAFIGLENTGNYISPKFKGVYQDQNYDCRTRPWYRDAKNAKKFVPGTMVYDASDSSTSLTGLLPIREEDGTLLGITGVDININFAVNMINAIRFGKGGRGFLVMQDRQLLSFPELGFKIGRYLKNIKDEIKGAQGFTELDSLIWNRDEGSESVEMNGEDYTVFYTTLKSLQWKLGILVPSNEIVAPLNDLLKSSIFYLFLGALIMLAAAYYIANPIIRPMEDLAVRFRDLAGLEGDLTHQIEVKTNDEIGQVSSGFNRFLEKIRSMVSTIKSRTQQIGVSIGQLVMSTNEMNGNAEKIATQTNEIATASKQLAQSISQITQNTKMMEKNIAESGKTISESSGDMEKFIVGADTLVTGVRNISDSLEGLGEYSDKIEGTISFIDDIADRVSLLALNASIEAATAGEHGQGFQVVANEVKNLSDKIFDQTRETKYTLGSLAKLLKKALEDLEDLSTKANQEIAYSQKAKHAIVAMESAINDSNSSILEISAESEQQANSTQLISSSIDEIATNNQSFLKSIQASSQGVEVINKMVVDLQSLIRKFKS